MWNFINRNYWNVVVVVAVVLLIVCAISIIAGGTNDEPSWLENLANTAFSPIKAGLSTVGNSVGGFFDNISKSKNAAAENKKLKNKIKELENENERLLEYQNENDRLRKILELKDKQQGYTTVASLVIGRSFSSWSTEFVIDKGTDDGVDVGNVIIENGGLVGSVTKAGENWARVTTILDPESSVSAMVIRSGAAGIVEGDIELSDDNLCVMNYTMKDADIAIGDTVESSGLGKLYPQGIVIGKVKTVEQKAGQISRKITVEISADIHNLKEVLVITAY